MWESNITNVGVLRYENPEQMLVFVKRHSIINVHKDEPEELLRKEKFGTKNSKLDLMERHELEFICGSRWT